MLISDDKHLQIGTKDRLLLKRINENPDLFYDITIMEFAKRAKTSTSAISKFIRKLHFEGYRDFQNHLTRQKISSESANRIFLENNALIIKDQNLGIKNCDHYFLTKTINSLDYSNLMALVDQIEQAEKIWIFGHENSYLAALDLTNSLINLGKIAFATIDIDEIIWQSKYLTKRDLVIFISENWEMDNYYDLSRDLKSKNIPTAAITGMNKFFAPTTNFAIIFYVPLRKKKKTYASSCKIQELFINNLLIEVLAKRITKK